MKTMRLVWNIIMIVVIVIVLAVFALLYGTSVFGYNAYIITGSSMEPAYKANSVAYVSPRDSYERGDVILFSFSNESGNQVAISRINGVNEDGTYYTKSDDSNVNDDGVRTKSDINGKVVFAIPYLGMIPGLMKSLNAIYIVLGVALLLISATIIINVIYRESQLEEAQLNEMISAEPHDEKPENVPEEAHDNEPSDTQSDEEKLDAPGNDEVEEKKESVEKEEEPTAAYVPIGFSEPAPVVPEKEEREPEKKEEVYRPIGNDDEASVYEVIYKRGNR